MLNTLKIAILPAAGLGSNAAPAFALQTSVTQVDKTANDTMTYHSSIKLDQGETLNPADGKSPTNLVTVYSFLGLIKGPAKSPAGWEFSSEEFGRTPTLNGYPLVLPVDVPNTPNLTWTITRPVTVGAQVDGFTAVTRVGTMVQGEYSASKSTWQSVGDHLAIALGREAIRHGYSVLFTPATALVTTLVKGHTEGRLEQRLSQLAKPKLLIMDEFGYLPFEPAAAHLLFQLVSRRYERGGILITSNRAVGDWGTVLGDQVVATAILDRLLHHSHVLTIRGDSYRLREKATKVFSSRSMIATGATP